VGNATSPDAAASENEKKRFPWQLLALAAWARSAKQSPRKGTIGRVPNWSLERKDHPAWFQAFQVKSTPKSPIAALTSHQDRLL
jgi:hypothetical protein